MKHILVSDETKRDVDALVAFFSIKSGRRARFDEVLQQLIKDFEKREPDFAVVREKMQ